MAAAKGYPAGTLIYPAGMKLPGGTLLTPASCGDRARIRCNSCARIRKVRFSVYWLQRRLGCRSCAPARRKLGRTFKAGTRFGAWTLVNDAYSSTSAKALFRCKCGVVAVRGLKYIVWGKSSGCPRCARRCGIQPGCKKKWIAPGTCFGTLTLLDEIRGAKGPPVRVRVECTCGNVELISPWTLLYNGEPSKRTCSFCSPAPNWTRAKSGGVRGVTWNACSASWTVVCQATCIGTYDRLEDAKRALAWARKHMVEINRAELLR